MGDPAVIFPPQYIGRGKVGIRFWQDSIPAAQIARGHVARMCEALSVMVGILGPRGVKEAEIGVLWNSASVVAMRFSITIGA